MYDGVVSVIGLGFDADRSTKVAYLELGRTSSRRADRETSERL